MRKERKRTKLEKIAQTLAILANNVFLISFVFTAEIGLCSCSRY
jgi:hypothetical protein